VRAADSTGIARGGALRDRVAVVQHFDPHA